MPRLFLLERICLQRFVFNSSNTEEKLLVKSGAHLKSQADFYLFDVLVVLVVSVMEVDHECVLQPNKPLYKFIHVK